jgi:DNA-binding NtrC family response regulator
MRSLLIVDDEADARFTLRQMLRKLECTVLEASDGVAALEVINENPVDLVISDIRMPRMDGMRLLREIKDTRGDIEVLLITAYGEIKDALEALEQGAFGYICKPVGKDELVVKVEKALMKRDLERRNGFQGRGTTE